MWEPIHVPRETKDWKPDHPSRKQLGNVVSLTNAEAFLKSRLNHFYSIQIRFNNN
jgi:hypothetical protein